MVHFAQLVILHKGTIVRMFAYYSRLCNSHTCSFIQLMRLSRQKLRNVMRRVTRSRKPRDPAP